MQYKIISSTSPSFLQENLDTVKGDPKGVLDYILFTYFENNSRMVYLLEKSEFKYSLGPNNNLIATYGNLQFAIGTLNSKNEFNPKLRSTIHAGFTVTTPRLNTSKNIADYLNQMILTSGTVKNFTDELNQLINKEQLVVYNPMNQKLSCFVIFRIGDDEPFQYFKFTFAQSGALLRQVIVEILD